MRRRHMTTVDMPPRDLWSQSIACVDPDWLAARDATGARATVERDCWQGFLAGRTCDHGDWYVAEALAWQAWPGRQAWLRQHPWAANFTDDTEPRSTP